ncbi:hypothetical protein SUGI_1033530 [Cryptomeria japonica]|uniref:indole-3-acetic acid-induced protein ARG7 n=1 Tax=Cryptomeria japonica TaxID=3369 RepID=UPI002414975F|nr:indole-3-acetic acid-induced protein ARG7 [Cryptomeria japonica]GLJ48987.1 hypothetical protein SUGI_1033530 [Cryptomeria japonica]
MARRTDGQEKKKRFDGAGKKVEFAPKGCLVVYVGEEQERFCIPVDYLCHPVFHELLQGAEEAYGFCHPGPLRIPCHVDRFKQLTRCIPDKQMLCTCDESVESRNGFFRRVRLLWLRYVSKHGRCGFSPLYRQERLKGRS